jgi:16S rRNA G527 N7-methylase RsmG
MDSMHRIHKMFNEHGASEEEIETALKANAFIYVPWNHIYGIIEIVNVHPKAKTFVDLGCGVPIIPYVVNLIFPEVKTTGYEIRKSIVQSAGRYNNHVDLHEGNILDLSEELSTFDIIYYYNPIADSKKMLTLCANIKKNSHKGQVIIPAASPHEYRPKEDWVDKIINGIYIYVKQ